MIKRILAKYAYLPLYISLYRKDNTLEYYRKYAKMQWDALDENKRFQAKRLFALVKYASENIPYYMELVKQKKISLTEDTIFQDIKKFPIMTKDLLRKEFDRLNKPIEGVKWHYNHSGGSTGQPVKLVQDSNYHAEASAVTEIQYDWARYSFGDPMVKLWGSQHDVLKEKEKLRHRFASWIKSITLLNSFAMNDELMRNYVRIINKKKPKMILAYAQSANELSKFINESNLSVHSPKSVMTSAGILYPQFRENIEKAFRCPVFNRYGSREIGNVASECEKHEGLHVSTFTHFIEVLNNKMQPCKEGELGDIYATVLINYTMPLIRYKIGDMAIYTEKRCSCNRGLPLLKDIVGRDMDVFKTKDGRIIQGEFFIHFIGVVYNEGFISKFQAIQKSYDDILIKVVLKDESGFDRYKQKIIDAIKNVMGKSCKITFEKVTDISPTKSGKYRYTVREFL